ncbi:hypothetical protein MMC28_002678 [Mycoblastus sanguinarius]|nr:hypothetical protein [Mycoblastus sanguinarius]
MIAYTAYKQYKKHQAKKEGNEHPSTMDDAHSQKVLATEPQSQQPFRPSQEKSPLPSDYVQRMSSILSFLALIYFILATGPIPILKILPWFIFGQLGLDAVMFIFWLSASASSSYSCTNLCNACLAYDYISYDTQSCICLDEFQPDQKRSTIRDNPFGKRTPRIHSSSGNSGSSLANSGSSIAAKQAFDAIMTVIFAACLASTILWIIKSPQSGRTTATHSVPTGPIKHEEAGGAPAPAYTQAEPAYSNYQMQSHSGHAGQPVTQPDGYTQQPMQQGQYPTNHQYPQNQSQPQYPQQPLHQTQHQTQYPPQEASYAAPKDAVSEMQSPTYPSNEGTMSSKDEATIEMSSLAHDGKGA